MKPLAESNAYIETTLDRKQGVERNVRSSSAVEGISAGTFRSAASGAFVERSPDGKSASTKARTKKQ